MNDKLTQRTDDFLRRNAGATIKLGGVDVVGLVRELADEMGRLRRLLKEQYDMSTGGLHPTWVCDDDCSGCCSENE